MLKLCASWKILFFIAYSNAPHSDGKLYLNITGATVCSGIKQCMNVENAVKFAFDKTCFKMFTYDIAYGFLTVFDIRFKML